MGALLEQIAEWLKGMLVDGIMNNLSGMFDAVNRQVADVATQVGSTPASFSPGVFALVRNISESVIIPIAGMFLTFIACYELIQLIIEHNNLANIETWIFFKWIFKTFVAVMLITNTFNIVMAVFDEKGEETVHFLNMVDERDLFALMEDDEKAAYESQLAAEQAAREAAEKAAAEAASQTGESETQKPEDEPAKEGKKTNMAPILIIIVLMAAAGGGWFFMQTKKKKKAESAPDPDADYTDEDDEDYGAGTDTEDIDSYDVGDPYESEILDDPDESADSGEEDE